MTRCPDETRATNSIGNTTSSLNELRPLESAIMKDPLLNEILKAELDRKKNLDRGFDIKYIDSIR